PPPATPPPDPPPTPASTPLPPASPGSALATCGASYPLPISAIDPPPPPQAWPARTCRQAFDPGHGWALSGTGPDYQCRQTFPVTVPGGAGGPLAGHVLQYVASLVSHGAQVVSIIQSHPFVLIYPAPELTVLRRPAAANPRPASSA